MLLNALFIDSLSCSRTSKIVLKVNIVLPEAFSGVKNAWAGNGWGIGFGESK